MRCRGHRIFRRDENSSAARAWAGIVSHHKLIAEQELTLRVKATNHETEVRVVGEVGEEDGKHTYDVTFVDDDLNFW